MTNTPAEAVAKSKRYTGYSPSGMCQQFTRICFGIGSGFGSAASAWRGAKRRHHTSDASSIPSGVPVYWLGGSRGFGHTAVSLGNGLVRSTDWPRSRSVGTARITDISRAWNQTLVGWAEDINGIPIPGAREKAPDGEPNIQLKHVIWATRNAGGIRHGKRLKAAVAKEVGKDGMNLASPVLGPKFREQYSEVQRKYLRTHKREITKVAINGVPGPESLTWLGKRHGFDVIS